MPKDHPTVIGPYTLTEILGEGGMGVVYLAEQTEPVRRTVALKVVRTDRRTSEVLSRFRAERQALARMDHPSIAKIFDAGVTEDGHPYFVMEWVDGLPLRRFCDEEKLTVRERVRLVADLCLAVQHAHQKGLIHRDLKPSNVLVSRTDGRPLPRIIDFGIAKVIESEDPDDIRLTREDQVIGSPAFMSPEQITGAEDVDTRSDIYSLGVLLFETLVGCLPYEDSAYRGWTSVLAALQSDPPSLVRRLALQKEKQDQVAEERRTSVSRLRRELSGDLEHIVCRAMERDRRFRYETANGLALDLDRFLSNQPVRARGAGAWYVTRKFVRRNRIGVAFAATVAVSLVAFTFVTVVQSGRIARARDEAEARRGQAEGLIEFMLGDLRDKLAPIGRLEILDDVGDQAIQYFSSIPEAQFSDDELASRSQALYQIGGVRLDQGEYEAAGAAFAESLRLARALSERHPDDPDRLFGLGQSYFYVGYVSYLGGDLAGAEAEFVQYLDAAERLVAHDPANLDYRLELAYAHSNLGSVREARGDLRGAVEAYTQTLLVKEYLVARDSTNVQWVGELAETHNTLAVAYRKLGEFQKARESHQAELDLKRGLLERNPDESYWRFRLGMAYQFLAELQVLTGEIPAALANARSSFSVLDSLSRADPANLNWEREAVLAGRRVGLVEAYSGMGTEARSDLDSALLRAGALVQRSPDVVRFRTARARVRMDRARALLVLGAPAEALEEARTAGTEIQASNAEGRARLTLDAANSLVLGHALAETGEPAAARRAWERVEELMEEERGAPGFEELRPMLAEAYLSLGRLTEAREEMDYLVGRGYREPYLVELATAKGVVPSPGGRS